MRALARWLGDDPFPLEKGRVGATGVAPAILRRACRFLSAVNGEVACARPSGSLRVISKPEVR